MRAKRLILVIDDEEHFCKLMKWNIELTQEYDCVAANNGETGLEMVKKQKPDLVLLDIMMPGMGGLEVLKRIKAIAPETPVAMVTAVWSDEEGKRCFEAGAFEYLTKPVDFEHLKVSLLSKLF